AGVRQLMAPKPKPNLPATRPSITTPLRSPNAQELLSKPWVGPLLAHNNPVVTKVR
ncbi:hypothetical protein FRC08_013860, partial [Ceratobasidium sp. 394]